MNSACNCTQLGEVESINDFPKEWLTIRTANLEAVENNLRYLTGKYISSMERVDYPFFLESYEKAYLVTLK